MGLHRINRGLTIVELLIVIVVIAILAAISVVAYTGIQNRANDSVVSSDLSNLAKQYEMFAIDGDGTYPSLAADLETLNASISKGAYMVNPEAAYNLVTCHASGATRYAITAISKSGKRFYITNGGSVREYTGSAVWYPGSTYSTICASVLPGSTIITGGAGYGNAWRAWAND